MNRNAPWQYFGQGTLSLGSHHQRWNRSDRSDGKWLSKCCAWWISMFCTRWNATWMVEIGLHALRLETWGVLYGNVRAVSFRCLVWKDHKMGTFMFSQPIVFDSWLLPLLLFWLTSHFGIVFLYSNTSNCTIVVCWAVSLSLAGLASVWSGSIFSDLIAVLEGMAQNRQTIVYKLSSTSTCLLSFI